MKFNKYFQPIFCDGYNYLSMIGMTSIEWKGPQVLFYHPSIYGTQWGLASVKRWFSIQKCILKLGMYIIVTNISQWKYERLTEGISIFSSVSDATRILAIRWQTHLKVAWNTALNEVSFRYKNILRNFAYKCVCLCIIYIYNYLYHYNWNEICLANYIEYVSIISIYETFFIMSLSLFPWLKWWC